MMDTTRRFSRSISRAARIAAVLGLCAFGISVHAAAPACPPITVSPSATHLPAAALQIPYSQTFSAGGSGSTPFAYDVTSGLPASIGLTLDPSTGTLSGTPTQGGEFITTITATDSAGCSGGRTYVLDVAPAVLSTVPANGATSVGINSTVTINFTEAVNVTGTAFSLQCPNGTPVAFTLSPAAPGGATSFVLTPSASLPANTTCSAKVTAMQVTSVANALAMPSDYTFTFATGTQPAVTSTTPAGNATNVSTTATISLTFNESVNASSSAFTLECPSGTPQAFSASASPATTFTLTPGSPLPAGAVCTVTAVAAQITDAATSSIHPAADYTFTFTVDAAPTVTSTTPANGASNVALTSTITFTFDKAVNIASASAFALECPAGTPVGFTVSPAAPGNATTFTLTPSGALPSGTTCVATAVASQISDQLGTHMSANSSTSFTTDSPPTVTTTTPANGATTVSGSTTIGITFSKSVNITASAFALQCPIGTPEAFSTSPAAPGNTTTFTLTPGATLPAGTTCTVTVVATQVTDAVGTAMSSNFVFTFTTDAAPTVTSTVPASNGTIVDTAPISFTFSKAVNVSASAFTLQCPNGSAVPFTLSPAPPGGTTTFTLTPTSNMPPNTTCVATAVASQISDLVGTHLAANYPFSFVTVPPPPVATNDTYPEAVTGNVSVNSALIAYSVTSNDSSQTAFTITAYDSTSANGGTVSMTTSGANMGQFTYNPPAGFKGSDSFTYTITNTGGSSTATVGITVSGMIWFIDGAASVGDGRLSSPFNSLASFQSINDGAGRHPAANASIFIYDNASSYTGPLMLLNGQLLIGQDATSSLTAISGLVPGVSSAALPATGGTPGGVKIVSASTDVTLASGNTVWGLTLGNASGVALSGGSVGSLKLRDLSVLNGTGSAIQLASGALDAILTTVSSSGGTNGISLTTTTGSFDIEGGGASDPANTTRGRTTAKNGGGTLALGSGGTIQNATGSGILLNSASNVTLRNVVVQNNGGAGVGTGADGITATSVAGLVIDNARITGQTGNSGLHATNSSAIAVQHSEIFSNATNPLVDGGQIWNVRLDAATGTASISNSLLYGSHENVLGIVSTGTTTLAVTASNDDIHDATSNTCFYSEARDSASLSVTLTGSSVHVCPNLGYIYNGNDSSGGGTISVTGNTFDGDGGNNSGGADIAIAHQGLGKTLTYDISGNTTRQSFVSGSGTSISVDLGGASNAATLLTGQVANNTVGTVGVTDSGSQLGSGVALQSNGPGTLTSVISSNVVNQATEGFAIIGSGTTDKINVSVHGNTFHGDPTGPNNYAGLELTSGGASGSDTLCAFVSGNTVFDATAVGAGGIIADTLAPGASIQLQGYSGASNDVSAITTFLNSATVATSETPAPLVLISGGTISARTTCAVLP